MKKYPTRVILWMALASGLIGACASPESASTPVTTRPPSSPPAATAAPATPATVPGAQTDLAQRAVADLAGRLKLPAEAIRVISVAQDEFPVDNLGCGKSDVVRPAFVTGWEITLQSGDQLYTYRAYGARLVACDVSR